MKRLTAADESERHTTEPNQNDAIIYELSKSCTEALGSRVGCILLRSYLIEMKQSKYIFSPQHSPPKYSHFIWKTKTNNKI